MRKLFAAVMVSLLASPALAQDVPAAAPSSPLMSALPLVAIFFVFFFLVIRPQQKQARQRQATLDALQKGDMIVTGGGVIAKVTKVGDDHVHAEIATGVEAKLLKSTVIGLYVKAEPVLAKVAADKKNPFVKNDNVGVSKSNVANDN